MASQVPAGALVDAIRSKSRVAIFSILAFTASALLFTVAPIPLFVYLGQALHAFSSCTLGPAMVALSCASPWRPVGARAQARPQRSLRLDRQRHGRGVDGGRRLLHLGTVGVLHDGRADARRSPPWFPWRGTRTGCRRRRRLRSAGASRGGHVQASGRYSAIGGFVCRLRRDLHLRQRRHAAARRQRHHQAAARRAWSLHACIVLPQLVMALLSPSIGQLAGRAGGGWC